MRHIELEVLQKRKAKVLSAVIHHFIKTAKPVGSSVLIEEYNIELSPAAVRNVMADLEKEGFLTHPHTSAGRIPTDKGYRAYVDSIVQLQKFAIEEEDKIKKEYEQKSKEIESVLSETSRILSGLSQYTGFVMAPKAQYDEIQSIELIPITKDEILIILLTHTGMVKNKRVNIVLSQGQLSRLRSFLNEKLRGVSLTDANKRIVKEIKDFRQSEEEMIEFAERICDIFYDIHDDIYIDGTSNTIAIPDFNDFEPIRSLIRFNEDKDKLIEIISKDFDSSGINVKIGSESMVKELKDLSMVTTVYKDGDKAVGILGIIGPKRMEYDKMMSLVNSVSKLLNDCLRDRRL